MSDDLYRVPAEHHAELAHLVQIVRHALSEQPHDRPGPSAATHRVLRIDLFSQTGAPEAALDDLSRPLQLLVVTDHDEATDLYPCLVNVQTRIRQAIERRDRLWRRARISVHTRSDFERQLAAGSTLIGYILRRGVNLHAAPSLVRPQVREISAQDALAEATGQNDAWRVKGAEFLARAAAGARLSRRKAVFLMHQAVEHAYVRALRVLALYASQSHDLPTLRALAEPVAPQLAQIWPDADGFQRGAFDALQRAYACRRSASPWNVSEAEVAWLAMRTTLLVNLVDSLCEESLVALGVLARDPTAGSLKAS